jgi:hypothetical protein
VQGERDKDHFLPLCFNLDVQDPQLSIMEALILSHTKPDVVMVNVEQVRVSVRKCFAFCKTSYIP